MAKPSCSTFANPSRKIFSTASVHPPAATGPADTVALRPKAPSGAKSLQPPTPPNSPTRSGRHIPLLTEARIHFHRGFYKDVAPPGLLVNNLCHVLHHPALSPRRGDSHRPSSDCSTRIRQSPTHNIPRNRQTILLLPGGEGRDEGGR